MLFVLVDHFDFLLVEFDDLLQPEFEEGLSVDGLWLEGFFEFEAFSLSLIMHVLLF